MDKGTKMTHGLAPPMTTEIELPRIRSQASSVHETEERGLATDAITYPTLSRWQTFTIISTVSGITVLNSMQNGIVTVGLPTIGKDLGLSQSLLLWYPAIISSLTLGHLPFILSHAVVFCFSQDKSPTS